jgi:ATP-dependent exoDNAse (exonuclease V) alpha subunit
MSAEHAYTALSRATDRTDLYVESGSAESEAHVPIVATSTAERLRNSFRRSSAKKLAIELARQYSERPERIGLGR